MVALLVRGWALRRQLTTAHAAVAQAGRQGCKSRLEQLLLQLSAARPTRPLGAPLAAKTSFMGAAAVIAFIIGIIIKVCQWSHYCYGLCAVTVAFGVHGLIVSVAVIVVVQCKPFVYTRVCRSLSIRLLLRFMLRPYC